MQYLLILSFYNLFIDAVSLPFLLLQWTLTYPTSDLLKSQIAADLHFVLHIQLKTGPRGTDLSFLKVQSTATHHGWDELIVAECCFVTLAGRIQA